MITAAVMRARCVFVLDVSVFVKSALVIIFFILFFFYLYFISEQAALILKSQPLLTS